MKDKIKVLAGLLFVITAIYGAYAHGKKEAAIEYAKGLNQGIDVGSELQRDMDILACKKAGWDFIEKRILPKKAISESPYAKKERVLALLLNLQADIATRCINTIK